MVFKYFEAASHVQAYNKFRPIPPAGLLKAITSFLEKELTTRELAVDIGCGSGQSTAVLSQDFEKVIGFDPSDEIIQTANKQNQLKNVEYRVSSAESLPIGDGAAELVTTVQAIHWFDLTKFYPEVKRILKKNGVFAVYGYNLPEPVADNDDVAPSALISKYYQEILGEYVYDQSRRVYLKNYTDPEFNQVPFVEGGVMTREEGFSTEISVSVSSITGYISTWSGFQNFARIKGQAAGETLLQKFEQELCELLGKKPEDVITVRYRYFLLMGRKN